MRNNKLSGKQKAMLIASQLYHKWKLDDMRRTQGNPVELVNSLLDLRNQIALKVVDAGLKDWVKFTTQLIDEKIEIVTLKGVRNVNRLVLIGKSKPHYFVSKAEFLAIPEVANIVARPDFVGFIGENSMISALYDDGEVFPVGAVVSDLGLGEVCLSAEAVRQALKDRSAEPGSAGGSDPQPPPEKPATGQPAPKAPHPDAPPESGANPADSNPS